MIPRIVALSALLMASATACRDPTQITLELSTDLPCDDVHTAITVAPASAVGERSPATQTDACAAGTIGSLVLVPADDPSGPVAVKVTTSVGTSLEQCLDPSNDDLSKCIIARRSLRFIEHTPLRLPIEMNESCLDVPCDEQTTCVSGSCVDAAVDPNDCIGSSSDCGPEGSGGAGGGGGSGGSGGAPTCGTPTTGQEIVLEAQNQFQLVDVAADPETCRWGVVWVVDDVELCFLRVSTDGSAVGTPACTPQLAPITDLDVTAVEGGTFAVVAFTASTQQAALFTGDDGGLSLAQSLAGVRSGDLAARPGELVLVYDTSANLVSFNTFATPSLRSTDAGPLAMLGADPRAEWSGSDFVLSYRDGPAAEGAHVLRDGWGTSFDPDGEAYDANDATSAIVLANHAASGIVGMIWEDLGANGELAQWGPASAIETGLAPANDYTFGTTGYTIAGTDAGWVVGFRSRGNGALTSYALDGTTVATSVMIAPTATDMAVAAIGDQVGVAWLHAGDSVRFRLVEARLDGL